MVILSLPAALTLISSRSSVPSASSLSLSSSLVHDPCLPATTRCSSRSWISVLPSLLQYLSEERDQFFPLPFCQAARLTIPVLSGALLRSTFDFGPARKRSRSTSSTFQPTLAALRQQHRLAQATSRVEGSRQRSGEHLTNPHSPPAPNPHPRSSAPNPFSRAPREKSRPRA
jgi:hypothetical protein